MAVTPAAALNSVPRDDRFFMPGEFARHERCWMLWPERPDVWRENAGPAQAAFAEVAGAISRFEPVTVGVSAMQFERARQMLPQRVSLLRLTYNDAWMRDNGPTFVINGAGETRGIDWRFNAWGGLYQDWMDDDRLAGQLLAHLGYARYRCPMVMEGGAIDVDGEGTLIVTAQSILDAKRNPELSPAQAEAYLRAYLNVDRVIWLGRGVFNDETSGHVDNLCCFIRPGVVALTWTDDWTDPQYAISQAAEAILRQAVDAKGRRIEVVRIHQPTPMTVTAEEATGLVAAAGSYARPANLRLAGSYINYYVCNGGVIVPQFDDRHDQAALATLRELFPQRDVVGVYAREILLGGGNIHCITQQQPAANVGAAAGEING